MIPAPVGYHCPDCVAQARREFQRGPGRPLRGGVTVTKALLLAIGAVFTLEVVVGGPQALFDPSRRTLIDLGAMQPFLIANGQYWRLFAAMFLHYGLLHIGFNAYALWLFGSIVESNLGRTRMILIYVLSGFLASVASYAFGPEGSVGVGASGAIFGIFGAFIAFNYRRRHTAMAEANLRWAGMLIVLNILLAFAFGGRIDWRAHLAGLVAGLLTGAIADAWGSPAMRRTIRLVGFATLITIGVVLTVWRTTEIRTLPFFESGVAFFDV
jgi:membrane associated rhomboid family serine protease